MAARPSGRSGRAALEGCLREIRKGWASGLTVLTGGDLYHLDRAQRALLGALVPEGMSDFALTVFGDRPVDASAVVAAARSAGMFSERRVVLVRDLAALEGEAEALAAYAADAPASSYLIVRAPELDKRRKLHKVLLQAGHVVEFKATGAQDAASLQGDVAALAKEKGLTLDRRVALMLAELSGGDFCRIDSELDKIGLWFASEEDRPVTPEDLRAVAVGSAILSGWEVASAVLRHDRPAAVEALHRLLEGGEEPLRLLGGLAYRSRSMLQARAMIERGVAPVQAVRAARIWGEAPAQAAAGLARYALPELLRFPALLLEADRTLKSRSLAPRAVLGSLLDSMLPGEDGPARRAT